MVKVRFEKARDAHAGDILYHTSCWERYIIRCKPDFETEMTVDEKQLIAKIVLSDIAVAVKKELAKGSTFHLKDIVTLYENRLEEQGESDYRSSSMKRKTVKQHLQNCIENIAFEDSIRKNESQRVLAKDVCQMAVQVAIDNHKGGDADEINVLRRAARILRRASVDYTKTHDINFQGSVDNGCKEN